MDELGLLTLSPVLQSLEIIIRLLLAVALLIVLCEVIMLLASLISLAPPKPFGRRTS